MYIFPGNCHKTFVLTFSIQSTHPHDATKITSTRNFQRELPQTAVRVKVPLGLSSSLKIVVKRGGFWTDNSSHDVIVFKFCFCWICVEVYHVRFYFSLYMLYSRSENMMNCFFYSEHIAREGSFPFLSPVSQ